MLGWSSRSAVPKSRRRPWLRTLAARLETSPIRLLVAVALSLAVATLVARPGLLGGGLGKGFDALTGANTTFFWVAGAAFIVSLIASSLTWKTALDACGARLSTHDACARYGVGSLVNTVAPMRLGDVARVVLFSRTLKQDRDRALTAGGALGAVSVARALVQAVLVAVAAMIGALPVWPVAALGGLALCVVPIAFLARRRLPRHRIAHLLDAFGALARSPRRALLAARMDDRGGGCAGGRRDGDHELAGDSMVAGNRSDHHGRPRSGDDDPAYTPGNLGIATGAVALALQSRGVPLTTAVASGLAFHAVEMVAGLAFGGAGVLTLARFPSPAHAVGAFGSPAPHAGCSWSQVSPPRFCPASPDTLGLRPPWPRVQPGYWAGARQGDLMTSVAERGSADRRLQPARTAAREVRRAPPCTLGATGRCLRDQHDTPIRRGNSEAL